MRDNIQQAVRDRLIGELRRSQARPIFHRAAVEAVIGSARLLSDRGISEGDVHQIADEEIDAIVKLIEERGGLR